MYEATGVSSNTSKGLVLLFSAVAVSSFSVFIRDVDVFSHHDIGGRDDNGDGRH